MHLHQLCLLLLIATKAAKATDFCNHDPRLRITTKKCERTDGTKRILVRIQKFKHGNPYHGLHDTLWALSHYVIHCLGTDDHKLTLRTKEPMSNFTFCKTPQEDLPERANEGAKCWAMVAVGAMAEQLGANVIGSDIAVEGCVDMDIYIGASVPPDYDLGVTPPEGYERKAKSCYFRYLSWFGRGCVDPEKDRACKDVGDGSELEPMLPDEQKAEAFMFVRNSMAQHFGLNLGRAGGNAGPVRVLLYDRSDTSRRQWAEPEKLYELLKRDKRIDVRFVPKTPPSVQGQIELYAWPDLVIAPHGAAMVNTIFMRPGSEIIEVWKFCRGRKEFTDGKWTSWHAPLLNFGLQYVGCHYVDAEDTQGPRYTDETQLMTAIEVAMERMERRLDLGALSGEVEGARTPVEARNKDEWVRENAETNIGTSLTNSEGRVHEEVRSRIGNRIAGSVQKMPNLVVANTEIAMGIVFAASASAVVLVSVSSKRRMQNLANVWFALCGHGLHMLHMICRGVYNGGRNSLRE